MWAMEEKPKPTSRRTFVKAAIVGGATAAVVGTAVLGPGLRPSVEAGPASFPQVGSHLVWLDKGENLFRRRNLLTGTAPPEIRAEMRIFLDRAERRYGPDMARWSGDPEAFPGLQAMTSRLFL